MLDQSRSQRQHNPREDAPGCDLFDGKPVFFTIENLEATVDVPDADSAETVFVFLIRPVPTQESLDILPILLRHAAVVLHL